MNEKYELYVWSSYGLGAAVLLWNLLLPLWRRRALLRSLNEARDEGE